ncbi:hypothetical protein [Hydrogenophaga sp.]|uniref:hypothetical protein n=1 Tax=Hydrogenophaga sp. TaxID=1904254 RepID=UPI002720350F|nr:hypothetical protein [Hydrogenophaga sp.]MDO8905531.1 hypothetical protein [Hydrogenophaga sp.]
MFLNKSVGVARGLVPLLMLMGLLLGACSKDDPQARLEATVRQLQKNIEARDAGAVMELVDARFRMQGDLDADRARRTMMGIFYRYANIKVFAVGHQTRIDPASSLTGYTEAQVLVTGAQGLIPERATPYSVRMEWRLVDDDWKLYDLKWE